MRLTNRLRDAFVEAVLRDVPSEDYTAQAAAIATEMAIKKLPQALQRAIAVDKSVLQYLKMTGVYFPSGMGSAMVPGLMGDNNGLRNAIGSAPEVVKLAEAFVQQRDSTKSLEQRLRSVAYACKTRKALFEALPECEKYLPPEEERGANLPAVSGLVTDLLKAGWPNGGKTNGKAAADGKVSHLSAAA